MLQLDKLNCKDIDQSSSLGRKEIHDYLSQLEGWQYNPESQDLSHTFKFNDHYEMMNFINQVAEISHQQDHHPNVSFSYNTCTISYTTHTINNITLKDLICARYVDNLKT